MVLSKRKRTKVPYIELKGKECPIGGTHKVWLGFGVDMLPAFCINGCGFYSTDVPEEEYEED